MSPIAVYAFAIVIMCAVCTLFQIFDAQSSFRMAKPNLAFESTKILVVAFMSRWNSWCACVFWRVRFAIQTIAALEFGLGTKTRTVRTFAQEIIASSRFSIAHERFANIISVARLAGTLSFRADALGLVRRHVAVCLFARIIVLASFTFL